MILILPAAGGDCAHPLGPGVLRRQARADHDAHGAPQTDRHRRQVTLLYSPCGQMALYTHYILFNLFKAFQPVWSFSATPALRRLQLATRLRSIPVFAGNFSKKYSEFRLIGTQFEKKNHVSNNY